MAIIYTYPIATPTSSDNILGSRLNPVTEEQETVQFGIGEVAALAANNYVEATVTVTKAQLTALQTTDVELIPAPGANKYIKVLAVSAFLDYTAPAYTFAQSIRLEINNITMCALPNTFGQSAANTPLIIGTSGAVGGGGNSSMQVKIRYQILDTASF
jgi:hypothetical protein